MKSRYFICILVINIFFLSVVQAQSIVSVTQDVLFHLTTFNTFIDFINDITASKIELFTNIIKLHDVQMGSGPEIPGINFSVEDANMTITNLFYDQRLNVTLTGQEGIESNLTIYYPVSPSNVQCPDCTNLIWEYDPIRNSINVTATL